MFNYLLRRILLMIPTLFGMTIVVFIVTAMAPGGIGGAMLAQSGNVRGAEAARIRAYYEKRYHINSPMHGSIWTLAESHLTSSGGRVDDEGNLGRFGFKASESGRQHRTSSSRSPI